MLRLLKGSQSVIRSREYTQAVLDRERPALTQAEEQRVSLHSHSLLSYRKQPAQFLPMTALWLP